EAQLNRADHPITIRAHVEKARSLANATGAEEFAEHRRLAGFCASFLFEDQGRSALTKHGPVTLPIERPERVVSEEPEPMIMKNGLRLHRRIVDNGYHAVGFAGFNRGSGLGQRHNTTDTLIGDTTV